MKKIILVFLVTVLQNIAFSALTGNEGMTLLWHLDEIGVKPEALDATSNNHYGFSGIYGNVFGGARTPFKSGYDYFHNHSCYIACTNLSSSIQNFRDKDFSFMIWAQTPDFENGSNITRLLARISNKTAAGGDVPWQLWVSNTNKAVHVSMQDWGANTKVITGETLDWEESAWYMITMTVDHSIANGINSYHVKVYRSKYGVANSTEIVLDNTMQFANGAGLANGNVLIVGAAPNGWVSKDQPLGWWRGTIDEVSLWINKNFTIEEINQIFNSYQNDTYTINEISSSYFSLNDSTSTPEPVDSIGDINCDVFGNVSNKAYSVFGNAYKGFSSNTSFVACTNVFNGSFTTRKWATVFWVKNIDVSKGNNALLVRGANARYGERSDIPFQVWIDKDNYLHLGLLNWSAKGTNIVSNIPLEIKEHTWYQVAVIHEIKFSETKNYQCDYMEVYFNEGGKDNIVTEPIISHLFDLSSSRFAKGSTICYGGGQNGYYTGCGPEGYIGGEIDEIYLLSDIVPSRATLTQNLQTCRPTSTIIVVR